MTVAGPPRASARRGPLHVVHVLNRDALAGTELMVAALAERSDPGVVRTTVVTLDAPGPVARRLRASGVPVVPLGPGSTAGLVRRLGAVLRRLRPDVLCGYGFRTGVVTRVLGRLVVPSARRVTGVRGLYVTEIEHLDGPRGRLVMAVERATAPLVDAYVANSPGALEVLRAHGIAARRLHWIPNGLDPAAWSVPDRSTSDGLPTVACVGRFTPVKRQSDVVAAAGLLRDRGTPARFVLAGDGPLRADVAAQVRAAGLEAVVTLPGALPPERVAALLATADVACLASSQEGMPGAVMEAMAAGVPVVGTRVNGIRDLVVDGVTGLLVPPGEPAALADAVGRLVADPAAARRMGAAGRRRIEDEFSLDASVRATTQLYLRLVRGASTEDHRPTTTAGSCSRRT
ncbi:glycosyltransferase [Patulibacter sp. SYSU D01012]|uniref:glycosyltransferase n=1 Tax=Patulibacter sp. SYSU D01012 TaxID=2817381 RepID=UPI001B302B44|nr:glycosyltransferase [Patulibacter sp. SYSU D01012]